MKRSAGSLPLSYRLAVVSRSLAAALGGYLLASLASVCLALLLPLAQVDATLTGLMASFVVYLLAFLWCFACRNAVQAWLGVLLPSAALALLGGITYWVSQP